MALTACVTDPASLTPHREFRHTVVRNGSQLNFDGCNVLDGTTVFSKRIDSLPAAASQAPVAASASEVTGPFSYRPADRGVWVGGNHYLFGIPFNRADGNTPPTVVDMEPGPDYTGLPDRDYDASMTLSFPTMRESQAFRDETLASPMPNALQTNDDHISTLVTASGSKPCALEEAIRYLEFGHPTAERGARWALPIKGQPTLPRAGGGITTGVDRAGFPMSPLSYHFDEMFEADGAAWRLRTDLATGQPIDSLNHALIITMDPDGIDATQHLWPADGTDGAGDPGMLRMGSRLRLTAAKLAQLQASNTNPETMVLMRTLRNYGVILHDSGDATQNTFGLSGSPDTRWSSAPGWPLDLPSGARIHLSDFELVDQSCYRNPTATPSNYFVAANNC